MRASALKQTHPGFLNVHQEMELIEIVHQMKQAGLSENFVVASFHAALEYEGITDLLLLWRDETDQNEKNEIIADLDRLLADCNQKERNEKVINLNDMESIAKDIRTFKDALLQIVMERGGITYLAKLTGIPQPSLSRFFNSNAMPQRATLLQIAKALNLKSLSINARWVA